MKLTIRNLPVFFIVILFSGCTKKSLSYFQNTNQPSFVTKNSIASLENVTDNTVENMDAQNQSVASVSPNDFFTNEDLVKENVGLKVQEKATFQTEIQGIEKVKSRHFAKIKKVQFEKKPKYERLGNAAGIFGFMAIGLILLGIVLAFFTSYAFMLITISFIAANIALLLGAFSIKKIEKKWKAKLGLAVGIILDILLISFMILVANF